MAVAPNFVDEGQTELYQSRVKVLEQIIDKKLSEDNNIRSQLIASGYVNIPIAYIYTRKMVEELASKYIALGWSRFTYVEANYDDDSSYIKIIR